MLCYRDKTFCSAPKENKCSNRKCEFFLTKRDETNANLLGLPISYANFFKECKLPKEET